MSLALVIARTALLTSIAAMFGVALATLGRNTAFALGAVFAWMAVIEGVVRSCGPAGRSTCGARTSARSCRGSR